jgi:hypothetical protein
MDWMHHARDKVGEMRCNCAYGSWRSGAGQMIPRERSTGRQLFMLRDVKKYKHKSITTREREVLHCW